MFPSFCHCTSEHQYKALQASKMSAPCPKLQIIFHFAAMLFQFTVWVTISVFSPLLRPTISH